MVFSAISMVSSFEADDDTNDLGGEEKMYALSCLIDAVRSKADWEKLYSTADLSSQKWNGLVCCSQHSYYGTFSFEDAGGRVLAVKVFLFTVLLAELEQHQKQSCLAGASTCFWTQGTDYDL